MYTLTSCMGLNVHGFESFYDLRSFSFVGAEWIAKVLCTFCGMKPQKFINPTKAKA